MDTKPPTTPETSSPLPDPSKLVQHLRQALKTPDPSDPLHQLNDATKQTLASDPTAAASTAYAELYAAPFHTVAIKWRRLYEEARLLSALTLLEEASRAGALSLDQQDAVITHVDMALIMTGAPRRRPEMSAILEYFAEPDAALPQILHPASAADQPPRKRARTVQAPYLHSIPASFPRSSMTTPLVKKAIPRVQAPSLARFSALLGAAQPAILTRAMEYWPALQRWPNPRYWLHRTHAGRRRVPVEFGRSYTDAGWGQGIVSFGTFLRQELLGWEHGVGPSIEIGSEDGDNAAADDDGGDGEGEDASGDCAAPPRGLGYLAQHDLLAQIPALRRDVAVPDYCYCQPAALHAPSDDCTNNADEADDDDATHDPMLNMWLGPAGTISPAHTDPHDNLLAQAVGRKYVRLYAPAAGAACLYPMGVAHHHPQAGDAGARGEAKEYSMANTASVDVALEVDYPPPQEDTTLGARERQRKEFPKLEQAEYVECVLGAGEMLLIPRGWWHFVQSLDVSASISFWW